MCNKLHHPAIIPEQGASEIVKISQQMVKLCGKLKWLVFSGTRCSSSFLVFIPIILPTIFVLVLENVHVLTGYSVRRDVTLRVEGIARNSVLCNTVRNYLFCCKAIAYVKLPILLVSHYCLSRYGKLQLLISYLCNQQSVYNVFKMLSV